MQLTQSVNNTPKEAKKPKPGLRIPCKFRPNISLSDIIAATIGPDVRSSDLNESYTDLPSELNDLPELHADNGLTTTWLTDQSKLRATTGATMSGHNNIPTLDTPVKTVQEPSAHLQQDNVFWDFSDNACDSFPEFSGHMPDASVSNDGFGIVPETIRTDSNSGNSLFSNNTRDSNIINSENSLDTNTGNSLFEGNSNLTRHLSGTGCETLKEGPLDFTALLSASSSNKNSTDAGYLSIFNQDTTSDDSNGQQSNTKSAHDKSNVSHDSDLEDSMHFVDPDDLSLYDTHPTSPNRKKRRLSEIGTTASVDSEFQDFIDLHALVENTNGNSLLKQPENRQLHHSSLLTSRRRHLSHQQGRTNLRNIKNSKSFCRTRSFSGTCAGHGSSPPLQKSLNTSLSSLSEQTSLSSHPFFSDLQSTLFSDCQTNECPKTLFETLTEKSYHDVYARERSLLAKFSSLQSKYPGEIQELSQFYRSQSAEIEAERLREIHGDNFAMSYRKHLNRYYDNQMHQIIDRVEKSLQLLSRTQRNFLPAIRGFKSRPILSRKAISMMQEWYERNQEHPYPGPSAVEALAKAGEINQEQVKKWFANKRNRLKQVKPMSEVMNLKRKRQYSAQW